MEEKQVFTDIKDVVAGPGQKKDAKQRMSGDEAKVVEKIQTEGKGEEVVGIDTGNTLVIGFDKPGPVFELFLHNEVFGYLGVGLILAVNEIIEEVIYIRQNPSHYSIKKKLIAVCLRKIIQSVVCGQYTQQGMDDHVVVLTLASERRDDAAHIGYYT